MAIRLRGSEVVELSPEVVAKFVLVDRDMFEAVVAVVGAAATGASGVMIYLARELKLSNEARVADAAAHAGMLRDLTRENNKTLERFDRRRRRDDDDTDVDVKPKAGGP